MLNSNLPRVPSLFGFSVGRQIMSMISEVRGADVSMSRPIDLNESARVTAAAAALPVWLMLPARPLGHIGARSLPLGMAAGATPRIDIAARAQ